MTKIKYFSSVVLFFSVLLASSIWIDSKRIVASAKNSMQEIDREIMKQEQRYIDNMKALLGSVPPNSADLQKYISAGSSSERRAAFSAVIASLGNTQNYVNNPVSRRFLDEMTGSLNRISRMEEEYGKAQQSYLKVCTGWQGRLVGCG